MANFFEKALNLGAKDVFLTPVVMKKNRLGSKLTVLVDVEKVDTLISSVFQETSSIGVRYYPVQRRVLERQMRIVQVFGVEIPVKVALLEDQEHEINAQPEFSACKKAAKKANKPLREIMRLALREYEKTNE